VTYILYGRDVIDVAVICCAEFIGRGKSMKRRTIIALAVVLMAFIAIFALGEGLEVTEAVEETAEYTSRFYATGWSLLPPALAIILALITKEVYSSLFIGIVAGALLYSNFNVEKAFLTIVSTETEGGMISKLTSAWNVGILMFLVTLGIIVVLVNRAGGSRAYGEWALKRIHTKKGALLATFGLGALIFVDDYFNCLTVGSVMRPVTDRFRISRVKLAYIIDATAAPICIIAPISSWSTAVSSTLEVDNGLEMFIRSIPFNFYAILTIVMVIAIAIMNVDFGSMAFYEKNAEETGNLGGLDTDDATITNSRGRIIDLILPVAVLIICCVLGMAYTGGLFEGVNFIDAMANCDASLGLVLGSIIALLFTIIFYIIRRVLKFSKCMDCIPEGFKQMVPAIMILLFAWTLSGMTGLLGADVFVRDLFDSSAKGLMNMLPAIVFIISVGLAFATGTSWGTFGILLPIVVKVVAPESPMYIVSISACLAGAVCGDHCSPISDTTIMASAGAMCKHVNHVSTQMPYAFLVAGVSFVMFIFAGFVSNAWICLPVAIALMIGVLLLIKLARRRKAANV